MDNILTQRVDIHLHMENLHTLKAYNVELTVKVHTLKEIRRWYMVSMDTQKVKVRM